MADGIKRLDDATRPEPPDLGEVTAAQKVPGAHLKLIHDQHRRAMAMIGQLIDEIESGVAEAGAVASDIQSLEMTQNLRRFGTLCGQHCQFIHGHHSIEDAYMFPELAGKAEAFARVIDRLIEEHSVIHALLMRLVGEINELGENPTAERFRAARATYGELERLLQSHFVYEEDSIGDALGVFGVGI
ncbi:MAG: hemerythrin domain-containing protein [Rhodobiaceae bacterium]|nr:hemerythrin domain-containing protein [Rhodobiaceae bacterium]